MTIKVPTWSVGIEDQGVNVFVAFASRVCDIYGYDTQYYISTDDIARMTNKIPQGIVEWLRSFPQIEDNMLIGDLLDATLIFQISSPKGFKRRANHRVGSTGIDIQLTDERYQMAWMYLLGCLNHNIISENLSKSGANNNTFGMHTFKITREAAAYIKVKDRKALREKYNDIK
ncbi:hypothetical protein UFOVP643_8 [uncultured Caudovirales phage]|uniref:Uncharacterized protein n=1 Tax=uncultured Caudovirales phage TaxID=2100421 RepID=A0A6J5N914_9CAUD|nr:hypothetical protein UFOVP643_8 [uncultured Caudovirales phage]